MRSTGESEHPRLVVGSPPAKRREKTLHPERLGELLPRRREHISVIRWTKSAQGDWLYEWEIGQFEGAHDRFWTLSCDGDLREYDMNVWSVCAN